MTIPVARKVAMRLTRKAALAFAAGLLAVGTATGIITYHQIHLAAPVTAVWHPYWTPLQCANHLAAAHCLDNE